MWGVGRGLPPGGADTAGEVPPTASAGAPLSRGDTGLGPTEAVHCFGLLMGLSLKSPDTLRSHRQESLTSYLDAPGPSGGHGELAARRGQPGF